MEASWGNVAKERTLKNRSEPAGIMWEGYGKEANLRLLIQAPTR